MTKGTVKWFNPAKGYGFLRPDDGEKDVFVHQVALEAARIGGLGEEQTVMFDIVTDAAGRQFAANMALA